MIALLSCLLLRTYYAHFILYNPAFVSCFVYAASPEVIIKFVYEIWNLTHFK